MKWLFSMVLISLIAACSYMAYKDLGTPDPTPPTPSAPKELPTEAIAYQYLDSALVSTCLKPAEPVTPAYNFVSYVTEEACIAANLQTIDPKQTEFYRYFTLANVWNTQPDDIFQRLKWALIKGINSISLEGVLANPYPVSNPPVIYRIDLRDYGLSENEFENIILPQYPYGINFFDQSEVGANERFIAQLTKSQHGWVRADWFLEQTMQPPLYYDLLKLPNTIDQLFKNLKINEARDIETFVARRAGIRKSGVANWNRILDEHPLSYSQQGTKLNTDLFRTFDVISQTDFRSFTSFPFGPANAVAPGTNHVFLFDASETILGLPNGLDAYFFSDGKGNRIDEALATVATDRANPAPYIGTAPFVIRNAVGCMHCHSASMETNFKDEFKESGIATTTFTQTEVDTLNQLYANSNEMTALLNSHATTFKNAMNSLIPNTPSVFDNSTEPVFWTVRWYEQNLDSNEASAELGIIPSQFISCMQHSADLAQLLGVGDIINGVIARQEWELHFAEVVKECNIGIQEKFGHNTVPTPTPTPPPVNCYLTIENKLSAAVEFQLSAKDKNIDKILRANEVYTSPFKGDQVLTAAWNEPKYPLHDCTAYQVIGTYGIDLIKKEQK